jgi:hypothetical protein
LHPLSIQIIFGPASSLQSLAKQFSEDLFRMFTIANSAVPFLLAYLIVASPAYAVHPTLTVTAPGPGTFTRFAPVPGAPSKSSPITITVPDPSTPSTVSILTLAIPAVGALSEIIPEPFPTKVIATILGVQTIITDRHFLGMASITSRLLSYEAKVGTSSAIMEVTSRAAAAETGVPRFMAGMAGALGAAAMML